MNSFVPIKHNKIIEINMNNRNFHLGYILIIIAGGLMLFEDSFNAGILLTIFYGVLALIGFIIMVKGFNKSKESN